METVKLNAVNLQPSLADILACLPAHPIRRIDELLPWNWIPPEQPKIAA